MAERPLDAKTAPCTLRGLLLYFLRLGAVGFGGPIALVGYMHRDLVEERRWISKDDYAEGLAFSQLAPGPLATQLAMYLGYVPYGIPGATLAAFAFILPSFLMVLAISRAYVRFGGLPWMQALFYGIGAAVIGIIVKAAHKLSKATLERDLLLWGIALVLAVVTAVTQTELVWLFLAGGLLAMFAKVPPWKQRGSSPAVFAVMPWFPVSSGAMTAASAGSLLAFFSKAGLMVFGSGLAIVPFLYGGVVKQYHWLTDRQFMDAVAVAMITPGPVVITAAFIGYLVKGLWGAVLAAAGVFLPVYLFVIAFSPWFNKNAKNPKIHAFVKGVTAAAIGAIAGAAVVLAKRSVVDVPTGVLALGTLGVLLRWKVPELWLIAAAGLLGLCFYQGTLH